MLKIPLTEIDFDLSRSSGAGGQNVNKTETKARGSWSFEKTACLTDRQKERLRLNPAFLRLLDDSGFLTVSDQTTRHQIKNKEKCAAKLEDIVLKALKPAKKRIKTKVSRAQKENRIRSKKERKKKLLLRKINSSSDF